jgi:hypothetical protein
VEVAGDMLVGLDVGEDVEGEDEVGEVVMGEVVRGCWEGEPVAGELVTGEVVTGESEEGEEEGEPVAGELVTGEVVTGESVEGEVVVGCWEVGWTVTGEAVTGEAVGSSGMVGKDLDMWLGQEVVSGRRLVLAFIKEPRFAARVGEAVGEEEGRPDEVSQIMSPLPSYRARFP